MILLTTQQKTHYYPEMNYLRGFAILSVISIHVSVYFTEMSDINSLTLLYMTIDTLSQAAVPAFVFISGFVLCNKYGTKFNIISFYMKRFEYILPPYLIFSTLYIIISFYYSKINGEPINLDISEILIKYLTGGAYYHLWFFVLITQLYLLYPLISKIIIYFQNKNSVRLLLTVIFLIGTIGTFFLGNDFLFPNSTQFISHLFYFVSGIVMRSNYKFIRLNSFLRNYSFCIFILLLLGTILIIGDYENEFFSYNFFNFDSKYDQIWEIFEIAVSTLYFTTIFLIMLYISMNLTKSEQLPIINKIGSYSFAIYLIHPMILDTVVLKLSEIGFDWNSLLFYPSIVTLTLTLSIFSVKTFKQIPYSKYIFGKIS